MNKTVKTVIRIAVLVLLAALVGLSLYSINAARLSGNALPMPLGFGMTVVLSGSMEPALSVGDLLIVVPQDAYQVEDVVVYQTSRTAVVHRIVAIEGEAYTTRGDANNTEDKPIAFENIKGKVIIVVPFVGYLVNLIKTPVGTAILLGLALLLLEMSFRSDKKQDQSQIDALKEEIERLKNE